MNTNSVVTPRDIQSQALNLEQAVRGVGKVEDAIIRLSIL